MAKVVIRDWRLVSSIAVDESNPDSTVAPDGTIINPKNVEYINVRLEIDGVTHKVTIDKPYSKQKIVDEVKKILQSRKTDVGVEFEVTLP